MGNPVTGPWHVKFIDGPIADRTQTIHGVLPFSQFMVDGSMEDPVFHLYGMDPAQERSDDGPVLYTFRRTLTFPEIAEFTFKTPAPAPAPV